MSIRAFTEWIAAAAVWLVAAGVTPSVAPAVVSSSAPENEVNRSQSIHDDHDLSDCPPYLGEGLPGRDPEPFAPEVFSVSASRIHGAAVFSPDGTRICWSVLPPAILSVHCENGTWSDPEILPVPGVAVQAPAFSVDGSRLYYQAAGTGGQGSVDIWWVDAQRGDWNHAVNLGPPVNSPGFESQPTLTKDGSIYYTASMADVEFDRGIYHAAWTSGRYEPPYPLGSSINTPGIDYCPFASADGTILLFASNRGHTGEELYIHAAFRTPEGGWTEPVNLHPIMSYPDTARFPSLSPDGRFLFFLSKGRIWWADADVLTAAAGLRFE